MADDPEKPRITLPSESIPTLPRKNWLSDMWGSLSIVPEPSKKPPSPSTDSASLLGYREDLRQDLTRAYDQHEASAESMSSHSSPDTLTGKVLDYVGLGFLLAPPEVLVLELVVSAGPVNWNLVIAAFIGCYAVGALLLGLGLRWEKVKPKLPARLAASITAVANNAIVWLIILLIFAFGPAIAVGIFTRHSSASPVNTPPSSAASPQDRLNPLQEVAAKWRLARNLSKSPSKFDCGIVIARYPSTYADHLAEDLKEVLDTVGWKRINQTLAPGPLPRALSIRSLDDGPSRSCANILYEIQ